MSTFDINAVLEVARNIDYVNLAKLIVPYEIFVKTPATTFLLLAHLAFYAFLLGTMIWVTFISGLVLFNNLPKQQFGTIQSYLFPWYFRVCTFSLAYLILCAFLEQHDIGTVKSTATKLLALKDTHSLNSAAAFAVLAILRDFIQPFLKLNIHNVQFGLLLTAYGTAVFQQFIVGPLTTRAMIKRHTIQNELAKPGKEKDAKLNSQLKSANKKFGMLHGFSSLHNLYILIVVIVHGIYFASVVLQFSNAVSPFKTAATPAAAPTSTKTH